MNRKLSPFVLVASLFLSACGGGGGSSGTTAEQYSIDLRSDKNILPVNIAGESVGQGVYAPYTTSLYVSAKRGGQTIPGGEDIFGCNIAAGIDSASLYYLDGDSEHEDDKGNPLAYRSIVLPANSGGSSFHLHAKNQAGKVSVVCSITDPRDSKQYTASVDIVVGGGSTNTPASVVTRGASPTPPNGGLLGTQGNTENMPTSAVLQTEVWNDNNQPVSGAGKQNVQVSILPTGYSNDASVGARLMAGGITAQSLSLTTNGGNAQYSISSGSKSGIIFIQTMADRADNDVSNGIQEPIRHLYVVQTSSHLPSQTALAVDSAQVAGVEIQNAQPFTFPLQATGGRPPYTWSLASPLPNGLSLTTAGILQGTPSVVNPGTVNVGLVVTDADGAFVNVLLPLTIVGSIPPTPVSLTIDGCSGNGICPLPGGVIGSSYSYPLSASGGTPITWTLRGAPTWLRADGVGTTGMLYSSSTLTCSNVGEYSFFVTASNATNAVTKQVSISVPTSTSCVVIPAVP